MNDETHDPTPEPPGENGARPGASNQAATTRPVVKSPREAARKYGLKVILRALQGLKDDGLLGTDPAVHEVAAEVRALLDGTPYVPPPAPVVSPDFLLEVGRCLDRIETNTAPGLGALLKLIGDRLERAESNNDHLHDDVMAMREWMRIPRPGCYPKHRRGRVRRLQARKD